MRKIKFCGLLIIGSLLGFMSSCLNSDSYEIEDWMLGNAQIASFSLTCDSISGIENVRFTIDQLNGKIFNKDSMPYLTDVSHKVFADIQYDSDLDVSSVLIIQQATGDTLENVTDSIDFSAPLMITVTAVDGNSKKTYEARLNIHQVNPDTMIWEKVADILPGKTFQDMKVVQFKGYCYMYAVENSDYQLYRSEEPGRVEWEPLTLSGFPDQALLPQLYGFGDELVVLSEEGVLYHSGDGREWMPFEIDRSIKTLLGYLPASTITGRNDVICCIAEADDGLQFISIDRQGMISQGKNVPENFPVSGFGQFNYETTHYPRLVIASGRDSRDHLSNKAWATMDGISWAMLSGSQMSYSIREGAAVFYYGNWFFVVGGYDDSGQTLKDINVSVDQGITWYNTYTVLVYQGEEGDDGSHEYIYDETTEKYYFYDERAYYSLAEEYEARGFSSVFVDKDNYIWLFGGKAKKDTNVLNEIWRGRINRLTFAKD